MISSKQLTIFQAEKYMIEAVMKQYNLDEQSACTEIDNSCMSPKDFGLVRLVNSEGHTYYWRDSEEDGVPPVAAIAAAHRETGEKELCVKGHKYKVLTEEEAAAYFDEQKYVGVGIADMWHRDIELATGFGYAEVGLWQLPVLPTLWAVRT